MGRLWLIRHGQAGAFPGEAYDVLSPRGEIQCGHLATHLHAEKIDAVFVGPLTRQRRSADAMYARLRDPLPRRSELAELAELPGEAIIAAAAAPEIGTAPWEHVRAAFVRWAEGWSPEGVEPFSAFEARVARALAALTAESGTVAAITSGGVIATMLGEVLGLRPARVIDLALMIKNASMTELLFSEGRVSLSTFNETPHLSDPSLVTRI